MMQNKKIFILFILCTNHIFAYPAAKIDSQDMPSACSQACRLKKNNNGTYSIDPSQKGSTCAIAAYVTRYGYSDGQCAIVQPSGSYNFYTYSAETENPCWGLIDSNWTSRMISPVFSYADMISIDFPIVAPYKLPNCPNSDSMLKILILKYGLYTGKCKELGCPELPVGTYIWKVPK